MQPQSTFTRIADDLVGMKVCHLWRGYGSALFLEFGALSSSGDTRRDGSSRNPRGEISIGIEWSWRIENATSIVCGSWSEEALWEPAFGLLKNSSVRTLSVFGRLPELDLALANGHHLLSFMTAEGEPGWSIIDWRSESPISLGVRDGVLRVDEATPPNS